MTNSLERHNTVQYFLMVMPQFIGFLLFGLYPIIWIIRLAWFRWPGYGEPVFIGLGNFARLFDGSNPEFWMSLSNTLIITFGKLMIELPLALMCAILLNRKLLKGRNFYRTVYFLPTIISPAILGLIFSFMFASHKGIINSLLLDLGWISSQLNFWDTRAKGLIIIAIASIWQGFGINMIFFLSGLQSIPDYLYESATMDGASPIQKFWYITIPKLAPILQVVFMLAMISTMKAADIVMVLTNGAPGGKTEVVMSYIYKRFFSTGGFRPQFGYAASMGLVTAVVIGAFTVVYLLITRNADKLED